MFTSIGSEFIVHRVIHVLTPVCDRFASTLQLKNGRYEVSLPWRDHHKDLPDNYNLSRSGLLKRLQQNQKVLQEYHSIIQDQLEQGIVEEL